MNKLTSKQHKAFMYIRNCSKTRGTSPTLRELCKYMGYKAVGSAQDVVEALRKKGYIEPSDKRIARSFILTQKGKDYGNSTEDVIDVGVNGYSIPCLGVVPAGNPLEAIEEKIGTLKISSALFSSPKPRGDKLFALKAKGLSMIGAGILDGDWLVVNSQHGANEGNIVVARVDGEATVKRLKKDTNGWFLQPENPDFQKIYAKDQPFEIIGKVLVLQRSV